MKNVICFIVLTLTLSSCKSQQINYELDKIQNEVIRVFLLQMNSDSYLDKHFFNKNLIGYFNSKYDLHRRKFKNSDSICRNSKDISKRKISCPLADTFKIYDTLLKDDDLFYLSKTYDNNKKIGVLDIDKLINGTTLQKHSNSYYKSMKYDIYDGIPKINEFPSIRIENIYLNQTNDIAIIAYSVVSSTTQVDTNFYILKEMNNVWWKPIGPFKI